MANETMTVNRLPALTWNWLKMNAARLEANAPAVGAAPSFVQTAQLARSSAAQDWAMETGMGTDVDRFLANSPAEYLTLGENEVMDAPAVITYTYQPGIPAGDRLYLEAKAGSTMKVAVILRNETAGEGLAALQIKIKAAAGAVVKLSMVQVLDNGFTCLSDIGTTCSDGASFELTKLELGSGKLYAGAAADLIGKGSNFTARIGYLGQGEQRLDMNYVARHRGKKTTWVVYGDGMAVLAGDALLNYAFETAFRAFENCYVDGVPVMARFKMLEQALKVLSKAAGIHGMIGGQTADLEAEGKQITEEQLLFIYRHKTADLIEASMMIGAILAGADEKTVTAMGKCAYNIGIAFQIQDDILDVEGEEAVLGKPLFSDEKNDKQTYVTMYGLEKAKKEVEKLSEEAICILKDCSGDSAFLEELTKYLIHRKK